MIESSLRVERPLPLHARHLFEQWNWAAAVQQPLALAGIMFGVATVFASPAAILLTTDFDIDIDGPGGNRATDPSWQGETSLRTAAGMSCDSRTFPGLVIPPRVRELGARLGDFGYCFWHGLMAPFQVYDLGPASKAGEGSVFLARELGIVPPHRSDRYAATQGNQVDDVVSVIFPRSAPGTGESVPNHALAPDLIADAAAALLNQFPPLG